MVLAALGLPAGAVEFDRGELRVELGGSARTLYTRTRALHLHTLQRYKINPSDTASLLGRLRLEGEFNYAERWSGQIVYDNEARSGTVIDSFDLALAEDIGTRTWFSLDHVISDHDDLFWRDLLYRGWVRYQDSRLEVTLGRQRIPLGRARLWNPTDLFNPIEPLAIEGDQRIGQDAVLGRLQFYDGLYVMGIWSPQDDPDEHRAAGRVEMVRPELDAALMAGRFGRDWVFGGDFARNVGGAALRGEATYTSVEGTDRDFWQVVLSIDYSAPIGSGVYLLAEHFYNENLVTPGDRELVALAQSFAVADAGPGCQPGTPPLPGAPSPPPLTNPQTKCLLNTLANATTPFLDRFTTIARNQTGFQAGYDLTPLLRTNLLAIYDWNGASLAIFPVLSWSARDDLDVSGGFQFFLGRDDDTEYGGRANVVYVQLDFFF